MCLSLIYGVSLERKGVVQDETCLVGDIEEVVACIRGAGPTEAHDCIHIIEVSERRNPLGLVDKLLFIDIDER